MAAAVVFIRCWSIEAQTALIDWLFIFREAVKQAAITNNAQKCILVFILFSLFFIKIIKYGVLSHHISESPLVTNLVNHKCEDINFGALFEFRHFDKTYTKKMRKARGQTQYPYKGKVQLRRGGGTSSRLQLRCGPELRLKNHFVRKKSHFVWNSSNFQHFEYNSTREAVAIVNHLS